MTSQQQEQPESSREDQIIVNPEYKDLVYEISPSEFKTLKNSISTYGQHVPIIVNQNNVILDGYNRYRACIELGINPRFMIREFQDRLLEKKFIINVNRNR